MEGERKKRKIESEEEDEEEKIEKFFALIRSTREMRELLRGNSSNHESKDKKDEKKMQEEDKAADAGAWNPAFQPEDFLEDYKSSGRHGEAGPSKTEEDDKKEDKGGNGLDLRLSL
ncbi:hypothetical protein ACE6H2_022052 [Prunus campanulata]